MLKVRWLDEVNDVAEESVEAGEVVVRGEMLFFLDHTGGVLLIVPQLRLLDAAEGTDA